MSSSSSALSEDRPETTDEQELIPTEAHPYRAGMKLAGSTLNCD
jgi:hypothetical protein